MIVAEFFKQPWDEQDYDIDVTPYLSELSGDAIASVSVSLPDCATGEASIGDGTREPSHQSGIVKFWVIGGVHGKSYKATLRIVTSAGRKKEYEVALNVSED